MKILIAAIILASSNFALAKPAPAVTIPGAQLIYLNLASTFPEFNESIGGFSYEINIKNLTCSSSNSIDKNGGATVITECTAEDEYGNQLVRPATGLFLTLINSKVPVDSQSEAGTSYITLENVNCGVLDPKPSKPTDVIVPEYFCTAQAQ